MQKKKNPQRGGLGFTDFEVFVSPTRPQENSTNIRIERKIHSKQG